MRRGPAFIEWDVFQTLMKDIPRKDGESYGDLRTAYTDMSRLVVGLMANSSTDHLKLLYNQLGWESTANVRQMQLAARLWYQKYHPDRLQQTSPEDL